MYCAERRGGTPTGRSLPFEDDFTIGYTLTVPTIWSPGASRVLQSAMEDGIQMSGLGRLSHSSIDNLFIISELEAAATWLVTICRPGLFHLGETFVLADARGATANLPRNLDIWSHTTGKTTSYRISNQSSVYGAIFNKSGSVQPGKGLPQAKW